MNRNILSIDFADILLLKSKYWECKKSHCRWLVCKLLGGKYQDMALIFYMIRKKFNMDGGILEVSWLKNIWEKFWSVYLILRLQL